jgi:hypothetical protein
MGPNTVFPRTKVQSLELAKSAHNLALTVIASGIWFTCTGWFSGASFLYWFLFTLFICIAVIKIRARLSVCLTVNEFGVIVQHQWSREVITWGEVAEIAVLCDLLKPNPKNDTLNNRSSRSRNERVVVLDGFERKGVLREIVIIRHSDPTRPFFVEPTSRFALEALQAGLQWQMDNFDRPLR